MTRSIMQRVWPWLERGAMRLVHRVLSRRSVDRTDALSVKNCLVLAPHPDDETLGCGGLIQRKRAAGASVHVTVVTDGAATHDGDEAQSLTRDALIDLRERETIEACAILGVEADAVSFLRLPDGDLAAHADGLRERLADIVARIAPEEVYVCALADGHRDHQALARAVRDLARTDRLGRADLLEYPVWFWDFRSWRPDGLSNKAGFVSGLRAALAHARRAPVQHVSIAGLVERKRAALACHRSQLGTYEGEPDWVGLPDAFLAHFNDDREFFFDVPRDRDS
ncbi:MAG: PIG-L deacetylase family protein [Pseudomonadota bacterium]